LYSVVKSSSGLTYFASDEGINLYPANGVFNPSWGSDGDRVIVGFYYNPYTVSETTTRMEINVETLISIQTDRSALPSTVDTVGTGLFLHGYDAGENGQNGIYAWAAQNYLTAVFFVRYDNAAKHTFGFIEEPELFRNDTLFLTMWHNAKESAKTQVGQSHLALNLSNYSDRLAIRDSTVISIKYNAENLNSSTIGNYVYNVVYRKKEN
jgi:hypothetical protein